MLKLPFKSLIKRKFINAFLISLLGVFAASSGIAGYYAYQTKAMVGSLNHQVLSEDQQVQALKSRDEYKINQDLNSEINHIHETYASASATYEKLLDFKVSNPKTDDLDKLYAQALKYLSDKNYASASASLADLNSQIDEANAKAASAQLAQSATSQAPSAPQSNTPPGSGLSRQTVQTDVGSFYVDIIAADLNSTKVIVDTASPSDCSNNCPALPLADYANRNGAFAGINGAFFCPPDYPSCAGKTNTFDTLLMNKNKTYFNSSNNVYSTIPAAIFFPGSARFVGRSLEWGRDTSPDAVIANYPMLVQGGNIVYAENSPSEPKFGGKGARCFIANRGSTVYIGTIFGATMSDAAHVLKTLGMDNALNLDEGGSTALWYQGSYLAGPGRALPDAVLFVKR